MDEDRVASQKVQDLITVFLLSVVAVLTAWCGFQASKWGGEMSVAFSDASSARIQAAAAEGQARDARQYDLTIYSQWVLAEADSREGLSSFVEGRFSPEFSIAFEEWDAGGREALGPFALDSYVPPGTQEAEDLAERADARFASALENNRRGDNYSLLTVMFALVLFLAAMSQRASVRWVQLALLGLAVVLSAAGILLLLTFPVSI